MTGAAIDIKTIQSLLVIFTFCLVLQVILLNFSHQRRIFYLVVNFGIFICILGLIFSNLAIGHTVHEYNVLFNKLQFVPDLLNQLAINNHNLTNTVQHFMLPKPVIQPEVTFLSHIKTGYNIINTGTGIINIGTGIFTSVKAAHILIGMVPFVAIAANPATVFMVIAGSVVGSVYHFWL